MANAGDREPRKALRGRFLRRQICESKSVAELIEERGPWAGLLFERMILHADDEGRFVAEPQVIRAKCIPWHERKLTDVAGDLAAMQALGMITVYTANGTQYGSFPSWNQHQPKAKSDRYIPSELPPPVGDDLAPSRNRVGTESEATRSAEAVAVAVAVADVEKYAPPNGDAPPRKPSNTPLGWYLTARKEAGKPPVAVNAGKLGSLVKRVESQVGTEECRRRFRVYLESDDPWYRKHSWDLDTFFSARTFNTLGDDGVDRTVPADVEIL